MSKKRLDVMKLNLLKEEEKALLTLIADILVEKILSEDMDCKDLKTPQDGIEPHK